jgi:uncharacterized protein YjeT (DUF2065 family)
MQKKLWLMIALLLVIPGLMFTVGCQKKAVSQAKAPAPACRLEYHAEQHLL